MMKLKYDPQVVASRIQLMRKKQGLKQIELAEKSGISINSLKNYESARRIPDNFNLQQIAHALNVDPFYLLGETEFSTWVEKYDATHHSEVIATRSEYEFINYCTTALGCDFSGFDEEMMELFKAKCREGIRLIFGEVKAGED